MKRFRFTIGNKVLLGFSILIVIYAVSATISIVTIGQGDQINRENSEVIDPSVRQLSELNHLVTQSKMLVTNWVYMYRNLQDQQRLDSLQQFEYPVLKQQLQQVAQRWDNPKQRAELDSVLTQLDGIFQVQRTEIMDNLRTFEDYEDSMIKFMAEESLSSQILPQMGQLQANLKNLIQAKTTEKEEATLLQMESFDRLRNATLAIAFIVVILGIIIALIIARTITTPVKYMKEIVLKLSRGILPEDGGRKFSNDEIGEMALALETLVSGLKSTSGFAENIGKGNYAASFEPLSGEDVLGNSLIDMRNNLQAVAEQDKRRNWATEGLAKFGEILRKQNDNIGNLSDTILSNLVKYMDANQGGLYIVNDENEGDPFLEMAACYAWDKKKYLEQKVYPGDGLTGQAWVEKATIYLTDVPDDYISITSGLGEANPTSILIVPLKINEEIYGLIEIASFDTFEPHQIEFVEKIAESIASTLSAVKINERTQRLLEESQQLTEQMRAQEEEMRQNMEELQATQEEMERTQTDRKTKESIINNTNLMFELAESFKISLVNAVTTQTLGYREEELRNMAFGSLVGSASALADAKRVVDEGHTWTGLLPLKNNKGEEVLTKASAGRIRDPYANTYKYLIFAANISTVAQSHEQL
ncbi:GAF domain-containing protein [Cesiribacter andamanensis]|uniref:Putative periplasmic ligand-binding sensor domain protein n=1 Tax=Cesiribacter andamanensis AMV16 TaxID=1279009 RepID=M7NMA8_9BACT|nr:GAF domain-containing protein [Cesiribacter andamanensis]EMR02920.1 putative periplasmic ligand-binding sensor domain protein [Cesiribacter andamanensis AMV16]